MIKAKQLLCWHEYKILYSHKYEFKNIYVCKVCQLYLLKQWDVKSKTKSSNLSDLIGEDKNNWNVINSE